MHLKRKGVGVFFLIIVVMLVGSVFTGGTLFGKTMIFEKRQLEEEILYVGNEVETYARLIDMAADLAVIQAIYDVGHGKVWESIPTVDELKLEIEDSARDLFEDYVDAYKNYFVERNTATYNRDRGITWGLEWSSDVEVTEFGRESISTAFGRVMITYESPIINIERPVSIESKVRTKLKKALRLIETVKEKVRGKIEKRGRFVCGDDLTEGAIKKIDKDLGGDIKFKFLKFESVQTEKFTKTVYEEVDVEGCFCDSDILENQYCSSACENAGVQCIPMVGECESKKITECREPFKCCRVSVEIETKIYDSSIEYTVYKGASVTEKDNLGLRFLIKLNNAGICKSSESC